MTRRRKLGPTIQTKIGIKTTTNKAPTRTIRRHTKNLPNKGNQKKAVQSVQDTDNEASDSNDHTFA